MTILNKRDYIIIEIILTPNKKYIFGSQQYLDEQVKLLDSYTIYLNLLLKNTLGNTRDYFFKYHYMNEYIKELLRFHFGIQIYTHKDLNILLCIPKQYSELTESMMQNMPKNARIRKRVPGDFRCIEKGNKESLYFTNLMKYQYNQETYEKEPFVEYIIPKFK